MPNKRPISIPMFQRQGQLGLLVTSADCGSAAGQVCCSLLQPPPPPSADHYSSAGGKSAPPTLYVSLGRPAAARVSSPPRQLCRSATLADQFHLYLVSERSQQIFVADFRSFLHFFGRLGRNKVTGDHSFTNWTAYPGLQ